MRRLLKAAVLGLALAWSMTPFEAKATAISLLTGRPLAVASFLNDDDTIGRAPQLAGHRRPARMARVAPAVPHLTAVRRGRGVPLPAFRSSYARRPAVFPVSALEGHALDLGRERAPPA